jgi:hypothetical protein
LVWAAFQRPSLPLALIVGVLVSYHVFLYDFGLLLLPIVLILNEAIASAPRSTRQKIALYLCVLLLIPPLYMLAIVMGRQYLLACPVTALLFCLPVSGSAALTAAIRQNGQTEGLFVHSQNGKAHKYT